MIGIVVVSHSAPVARAAVALAAEMVQAEDLPRIEVAAGLDEETFGTDASAIAEALVAADSGDGVLVLLDLGSAIMSTEMAVEFLDPEVAQRVAVSSAPLVEGLVAAVVTASAGASLQDVRAEAERGLMAKQDHLDGGAVTAVSADSDAETTDPDAETTGVGATESDGGSQTLTADGFPAAVPDSVRRVELLVDIPHGLHARPAARFVACVKRFSDARVRLRNLGGAAQFVDAGSLSAVATLSVGTGDWVEVRAVGGQADEALQALSELAAAGFGDRPQTPSSSSTSQGDTSDPDASSERPSDGAETVDPLGAGSGLEAAIGVVVRPAAKATAEDYRESGEPSIEKERLLRARSVARDQLSALIETMDTGTEAEAVEVFEAHQALMDDSALVDPARRAIEDGQPAAVAWQRAGDHVAGQFEALSDEYQRERAQDVRSVTDRVVQVLVDDSLDRDSDPCGSGQSWGGDGDDGEAAGSAAPSPGAQRPTILVVAELDPVAAATLDAHEVAGVLCTGGGATGHGVIIASARGIPVMTGVSEVVEVGEGTTVAFDCRTGLVMVDPTTSQRADFEDMVRRRGVQQAQDRAQAHDPGETSDGHRVAVRANVASAQEAGRAAEWGAEGSGLVRTEVVFEGWATMPTVAEQVEAFTAIAEALDGAPITIRTWDIGADKPLRFWRQQPEQNPFLGVRGLRSFRADPEPLRDQLRAVCQVAAHYPVSVMFPMVSTVEEVTWALGHLDAVCAEMPGGRPADLRVGIMVEVPAAALRARAMTTNVDFVSIGTNDLTQYVLAAERGNPGVDELFDTLDPAVLGLIAQVCREVADGVDVGVCGSAASDPASAAVLVGLGVHDLSASPVAVPRVKAVLRRHTLAALRAVASAAVDLGQAAEVRELLRADLTID